MSLVPNYGSSSESEDSDHEATPQQQTKRPLASLLPPPKKTVSIALPKLQDDEEDDLDRERKRPKTTVGLGLADLLPAPKNYKSVPVSKTTTDKAFIPHALSKKMKGKEKAIVQQEPSEVSKPNVNEEPQADVSDVEEDNEDATQESAKFTGSFFHIGKDLKDQEINIQPKIKPVLATPGPMYSVERPPVEQQPELAAVDMYAYDPNAMYSADPSVYYQYEQATNVEGLQDDPELERLVGKRVRGEGNIQIKEVKQHDMLPSEEWRRAQALTAAPKFNNGVAMQASKLQMKKNNIMALAAQAVNNQEKMDEMFAANKKTRREAAKKYGF
ncbi:hypothetical protein MAM1_0124c05954 [Mucor ambiguus]|uniref:Proline-rich protein PRCC n=1 Tax=Mucor ambiguus TaxID=91626 RepID=A0A0C9LVB2_9FUNG|nr:hypothetical protein MAM1_0124c05954 [Mucor ambiguus]